MTVTPSYAYAKELVHLLTDIIFPHSLRLALWRLQRSPLLTFFPPRFLRHNGHIRRHVFERLGRTEAMIASLSSHLS